MLHLQWRIQDFPEVEAPTLEGRGRANIQFCQIFPKKRKIERIWTGGRPKFYYVDQPLILIIIHVFD